MMGTEGLAVLRFNGLRFLFQSGLDDISWVFDLLSCLAVSNFALSLSKWTLLYYFGV
jgi:hypothetical protein